MCWPTSAIRKRRSRPRSAPFAPAYHPPQTVAPAAYKEVHKGLHYTLDLLKRTLELHTCALFFLDEDGTHFRITDIADGKVVVDGNHPLAGMALLFDVTVADVRQATLEELTHGHVHGPHGHHH